MWEDGSPREYRERYNAELETGIRVSGEGKDYFAASRVLSLAKKLRKLEVHPKRIMDFGCGMGSSIGPLLMEFSPDRLVGVDVSDQALAVARQDRPDERCEFTLIKNFKPTSDFDLVFCNGVFHHIPPPRRAAALEFVTQSLRPGGYFAFWDNNPWNPGARWVMSRIPFDRDAIMLSAREAARLIKEAGLLNRQTSYHFIFPRILRFFRPLESSLDGAPFGAQYLVLSSKPL